jgi:hypothetical protein
MVIMSIWMDDMWMSSDIVWLVIMAWWNVNGDNEPFTLYKLTLVNDGVINTSSYVIIIIQISSYVIITIQTSSYAIITIQTSSYECVNGDNVNDIYDEIWMTIMTYNEVWMVIMTYDEVWMVIMPFDKMRMVIH